jgi:WD40 repeat protein
MIALEGHQDIVTALAYAPDGRLLASGSADGQVKLWEPFSGRELADCLSVGVVATGVSSLAFSGDGRLLAGGYRGGNVLVWSPASGRILRQHALGSVEVLPWALPPALVAFHPQEETLGIAYFQSVVEVEPLSDHRRRTRHHPLARRSWPPGPDHYFRCFQYAPDGRLAAGELNLIYLWPANGAGDPLALHWPTGEITALGFSPDGYSLAVARERVVALWDLTALGRRQKRTRTWKHTEPVRAVAFTPDRTTLLSAGDDWTVHVWDLRTGQKRVEYNWRVGPVAALALSPDAMTVAVSGRKGPQVLIWDLE